MKKVILMVMMMFIINCSRENENIFGVDDSVAINDMLLEAENNEVTYNYSYTLNGESCDWINFTKYENSVKSYVLSKEYTKNNLTDYSETLNAKGTYKMVYISTRYLTKMVKDSVESINNLYVRTVTINNITEKQKLLIKNFLIDEYEIYYNEEKLIRYVDYIDYLIKESEK